MTEGKPPETPEITEIIEFIDVHPIGYIILALTIGAASAAVFLYLLARYQETREP